MIKTYLVAGLLALMSFISPATAAEWEFLSAESSGSEEGTDLARIRTQGHVAGVVLDLNANRWMLAVTVLPLNGRRDVKFAVLRKGELFERTIPEQQLSVEDAPIAGQEMLYFWLREDELERLMSGSELRVAAGSGRYAFTLSGSRAAITQLVSKLTPYRAALEEDKTHGIQQAISDCDQQAAHPWDERRSVQDGVKWGDIYADTAVASCREAAENTSGRTQVQMLYQLGRALDKAKDPEALRVLFKAGENYGHPMALNHLALLYRDGDYTDQDLFQAEKFFRMSHDKGSVVGSYNLAKFYLDYQSDDRFKRDEAYRILERTSHKGYPQAQELFGKELIAEKVDGRPDIEGLWHLEQASNAGRSCASMALAEIYRDGTVVGASPKHYLKFLRRAADQGNKAAKEELGLE